MNTIWNYLHKLNIGTTLQIFLFLFSTTLLSCVMGFIAWYALHFFVLNSISWAISFIGYTGFFVGFFGGILYLYRHII